MKENGHKIIREYLWDLSNGYCAYCGKKLSNYSDMDVDHFLPSSKFPYLSYCLENLIPSCKICNQTYKHDFVPKEIENKKIVEECISEIEENDSVYNKKKVLNELTLNTRIIDPTFDDTKQHLSFNAEFFMYETKTKIGENTNDMFFDKSEFVDLLEKMSNLVKLIVEGDRDNDYDIIKQLIDIEGYEFYYNKFYEY
ncbi:HNH endonuclease [Clostridium butyricum]